MNTAGNTGGRTLMLAAALLVSAGCDRSSPDSSVSSASIGDDSVAVSAESLPELELDLPLVNANPGYVGALVCGECHSGRLHEFRETRHFLAAARPVDELMPPKFEQQTIIQSHLPGITFTNARSGPSFSQSVSRPGGSAGRSVIALAYGMGGTADEVYFAWRGRELRELPLGWLHSHDCWGAQQFSDPGNTDDFSRVATTRCLECHNTWFEHRRGTANEYRPDSFLTGVSCERCHGPGREHVDFHRSHPTEKTAMHIAHPGRFSREQSMDNCGQCHSSSVFRKTDLFSFRPGDRLEDHFRQHENPNFEDDHVANQVKYLKQSRCYSQSESMTCVTCHSPHHRSTAAEQGDLSCAKCHQPDNCAEQGRLPAEVRGQCAACHMPKYQRLAVRFHTADDRYVFPVRPTRHRIGIYPDARDEVLLTWHQSQSSAESAAEVSRLKSALTARRHDDAAASVQSHRWIAAIGALREAVRWDVTDESRIKLQQAIQTQTSIDQHFAEAMRLQQGGQFESAIEQLESLLKLKPDHAMALAKIGTFQAVLGKSDQAIARLKESLPCDPDSSYGDNMLGWLAYLRGSFDEAVQHFEAAEKIYPWTAENNYRWSLALIALKRWPEAEQRLNHALQIHPDDPAICEAMSRVLRQQNRPLEAIRYAHHAAKLSNFRNRDILISLSEAWRDAGFPVKSRETAEMASAITETSAGDPAERLKSVLSPVPQDVKSQGAP